MLVTEYCTDPRITTASVPIYIRCFSFGMKTGVYLFDVLKFNWGFNHSMSM